MAEERLNSLEICRQSPRVKTFDDLIKSIFDEDEDHGIGIKHSTITSDLHNNITTMDATLESNGAGGSNLYYPLTDSELPSETENTLLQVLAPNPYDVTPDDFDLDGLLPSDVEAIIKDIENQDDKQPKDHPGDEGVVKSYLNISNNGNYNNQNTLQNSVYLEPGFDIYNLILPQPIPDQFNLNSPGLESYPIESSFISAPTVATENPGFGNLSEEATLTFDNNLLLSSNGKDIQESPVSPLYPSGYNAVPSFSSGAAVMEPEFKLPARKLKPSTKRGRPPLMLVTPSSEDLEKLSEEERRKLKSNIASRESRKKKKEQEFQDELEKRSLLKTNKSLQEKKARLEEHLRLLTEEFKRIHNH